MCTERHREPPRCQAVRPPFSCDAMHKRQSSLCTRSLYGYSAARWRLNFKSIHGIKNIMMESAMRSLFLVGLFLLGLAASAQPAAAADVRLFVRHEVTDYAVWRKVYNDFGKPRRNLGVTAQAVYRSAENPNDVTVTHDFKSMEQAKAFISSPDL